MGGVFAVFPLLPVEPPEVDALLFEGVDDAVKIGVGPCLLADAEGHGGTIALAACLCGVVLLYEAERLIAIDIVVRTVVVGGARQVVAHETVVAVLVGLDAGSGMEVEGGLEIHAVQCGEESGRVGEEVAVPCVARPSTALAELVASEALGHGLPCLVPVHVHNHHVDRYMA